MAGGKRKRTGQERLDIQRRLRASRAQAGRPVDVPAMPTRERLALALDGAGAPAAMVERARAGGYDEYTDDAVLPIVELVADARTAGLNDIVSRAVAGEFDATQDEADAYWSSSEGKSVMAELNRELGITLTDMAAAADANRPAVGNDGKVRLEQKWTAPPGDDHAALDADEVHAAVNLGGRCGATNFQMLPTYLTATSRARWSAGFLFRGVGTKTWTSRHASPAEAAEALVRKVLRGARCTDCEGLVHFPGDRGAWFPGSPGSPAVYHDGRNITVEQAMQLHQCRWRRIGRRWYSGCDLSRAAKLAGQEVTS